MKQNQTFFRGAYSNPTSVFIVHKILKYFNNFYNWHLSISLQKWPQTGKKKQNKIRRVKSDNIFPFLQGITLLK